MTIYVQQSVAIDVTETITVSDNPLVFADAHAVLSGGNLDPGILRSWLEGAGESARDEVAS